MMMQKVVVWIPRFNTNLTNIRYLDIIPSNRNQIPILYQVPEIRYLDTIPSNRNQKVVDNIVT